MVVIESIIKDVGTTPERYVFLFDDGAAVSVVDTELLPRYETPVSRAEASMTIESWIEDGTEVHGVPSWMAEVQTSTEPMTHAGDFEHVPEEYITAIKERVEVVA